MSAKLLHGKSQEKFSEYKEKRELFRTEDATVEVTVKLKKRKDKSKSRKNHHQHVYDAEPLIHKTGSWGDLLMRKKILADSQTTLNNQNGHNMIGDQESGPQRRTHLPPSYPYRVKVPITEDLYVQAETRHRVREYHQDGKNYHRKKTRHVKKGEETVQRTCSHHTNLGKDIQVQLPCCPTLSKCCDACTCFQVNVHDQESQTCMSLPIPATDSHPSSKLLKSSPTKERFHRGDVKSTVNIKPKASHSAPNKPMTTRDYSVPGLGGREENVSKKTKLEDAQVQTVEERLQGGKSDELDEPDNNLEEDLKKLSTLKVENDILRQDTVTLMQQVDKAKTERQEYITTIKELYELAEVLRHENVILIGTHEEHRTLQEKLLDALGENQVLKHHLQELSTQLSKSRSTDKHIKESNRHEELWKVRDVLKEVKTAIAEEIQGLKTGSVRKSPEVADDNILELFGMTGIESNGLNDTNAQCDDEIERILNVRPENGERFDVRSSTQYLDVGDDSEQSEPNTPVGRRFVPSPNDENELNF